MTLFTPILRVALPILGAAASLSVLAAVVEQALKNAVKRGKPFCHAFALEKITRAMYPFALFMWIVAAGCAALSIAFYHENTNLSMTVSFQIILFVLSVELLTVEYKLSWYVLIKLFHVVHWFSLPTLISRELINYIMKINQSPLQLQEYVIISLCWALAFLAPKIQMKRDTIGAISNRKCPQVQHFSASK